MADLTLLRSRVYEHDKHDAGWGTSDPVTTTYVVGHAGHILTVDASPGRRVRAVRYLSHAGFPDGLTAGAGSGCGADEGDGSGDGDASGHAPSELMYPDGCGAGNGGAYGKADGYGHGFFEELYWRT